MQLSPEHQSRLRRVVYAAGFFANASVALGAYTTSSFFEEWVGTANVGAIYALISLLMLALALNAQAIVELTGVRRTLIGTLLASLATGLGMVALANSWAGVALVIIHAAVTYLLMIALDLYLEHLSEDEVTGGIRGIFLTLPNLAYLASPLIASLALERYGFGAVFALSTLALAPLAWIFVDKLPALPHREYERLPIWHTARYLWQGATEHARDVRNTVLLGFTLNFFYAIMVIYEPIYLHRELGMSWPGIGLVFTVMLVPFVLLDILLGRIADKYWGEKELMITGLIIMGLVALAMPYVGTASVAAWALILFISRVGAATLEMMIESYLFKKIDSQNINSLFLSRSMNPLAYIVAPLLASLVLTAAPFPFLFTLLGVAMLLALPLAWQLKDTR